MKLCFFTSDIRNEYAFTDSIEIKTVVNIFRKKFKTVICGGTERGVMGEFANEFNKSGGGVTLLVSESLYKNHKELINTKGKIVKYKTLSERKEKMIDGCDAMLCYPGGLEIMDELFTYLAAQAVGEKKDERDVYLYNYDKFFSPLLLQLETAKEAGYISYDTLNRIKVFESPSQLEKII